MCESWRVLEEELCEITGVACRTRNLLTDPDQSPDSAKYLMVMRSVRRLRGVWAHHTQNISASFPAVQCQDPNLVSYLERVAAENRAIDEELEAITAAPWPRSTKVGLYSIRIRVIRVLTKLLRQADRERLTVIPLIRGVTNGMSSGASSRKLPEAPGAGLEAAHFAHLAG